MNGVWVFVCGPSGAGKDSVMAAARALLADRADIVFARRMVTRPPHAGSDHDQVSGGEFQTPLGSGSLCWHWWAHGFVYGIDSRYAQDVLSGCLVVVNGSRAHVSNLPVSLQLRVVQISASPQQLAQRMTQRARDSADAVTRRLARNADFADIAADCHIVNDTTLAVAARQLADYMTTLAVTP